MFDEKRQQGEYKGVADEIRQQKLKAKDMSLKGKLDYYWYYYKIPFFAVVGVLLLLFFIIRDVVTIKDYNFYALMLNSSNLNGTAIGESFAEYASLDTEKYDCYIDTDFTVSLQESSQYDMASYMKLIAQSATSDFDAMVMDASMFYKLTNSEMFTDLREVMTEEELASYEGRIFYVDQALIDAADETDYDYEESQAETNALANATEKEIAALVEEHKRPETMDDPIPVGILIDDSPFIKETGCYDGQIAIYAVSATSTRKETALQFLSYIYEESMDFSEMTYSFTTTNIS